VTSSPLDGLDLVALDGYLCAAGIDRDGELRAQLISGGRSNLTYLVADDSSKWVLRRPPLHHVDQVHPRLEGTHHASCGLLKHPIGNVIEEMTLELEINNEVDVSLVPKRRKCPCVC